MIKKKDRKFKKETKPSKKTIVTAKKPEEKFVAETLAKRMGISDFDFSVIRRQHKISRDSLITAAEMKKLYEQTFKGR